MKKILIIFSIAVVIGFLTIDFTPPVITQLAVDENKSLTTKSSARILVEVDDAEAVCNWEQISGPKAVRRDDKQFPFSEKPSRKNRCNAGFFKFSEPGELSILLTVTDKRNRTSTMTFPLTVAQAAPPKVCKNGKGVQQDSYGRYCCSEDMSIFYPNTLDSTVMDIKMSCQ